MKCTSNVDGLVRRAGSKRNEVTGKDCFSAKGLLSEMVRKTSKARMRVLLPDAFGP